MLLKPMYTSSSQFSSNERWVKPRGCFQYNSVGEKRRTSLTFPMARPKCLMGDFTNLYGMYKAHQTNVWWTMKAFRLHWYKTFFVGTGIPIKTIVKLSYLYNCNSYTGKKSPFTEITPSGARVGRFLPPGGRNRIKPRFKPSRKK